MSKSVGKISTIEMVLLLGGAGLALYFFLKPTTPVVTTVAKPVTTTSTANPENTAITTGGTVADTLINNLF